MRPFYAVKCNNLEPLIRTLKDAGTGFDCASSDEFDRVAGSDIIYANPCKARDELQKAARAGIQWCTFDTIDELEKIVHTLPDAKPILRIHVDDKGGARIPLNRKFGFPLNQIDRLRTPFTFYGLAFHVGSDCLSTRAYESAFKTVGDFYTALKGNPSFVPHTLDIGGGFSGNTKNDLFFNYQVAPLIRNEVSKLPFERIVAEPGRFFAEEACTLRVPVIGRKTLPDGTESLTIDDSVYGIFSGVLFDGFVPTFKTDREQEDRIPYTIFGRTCDSADKIAENVYLPAGMRERDVLTVESIGAYSYVSASEFNGFPRPDVIKTD